MANVSATELETVRKEVAELKVQIASIFNKLVSLCTGAKKEDK